MGGGHTLFGRLSGIRTHTGIVAAVGKWQWAGTLANVGRAPSLHYTLAFSLQLRKNRKTLSQGSRKVPNRTVVDTIRLVDLTVVLRAASTGLLTIITLGLRSMWRRQPSVSANTCRVADLSGSPHRITSSRNSRLGLRCGRQTTEHQNPSEFACYCCTKVHQYQREDTWTESPATSRPGNGVRTSSLGTRSPSWDG